MSDPTATAIAEGCQDAVMDTCPSAPNGQHAPHWRDWRVAEKESRQVPCEHCGVTIWPACQTCNGPLVGWVEHDHG